MPLQSLRVTKKEIDTYYLPKTFAYDRMVTSINAVGYGQIVQSYFGTEVTDTYYHEYSFNLGVMSVYNPTRGISVPEVEAGPTFWSVSAQQGLDFLNGTIDITGLRKLKYCVGCTNSNGLPYQAIDNFKKRFTQLNNLVGGYGTLDGFLFYDLDQPRYSNVYPSVKYDDGVNVIYKFKTVEGTDKSLEEISTDTGYNPIQIEVSISTAPVVKPQEGSNTVITSCCDGLSQVISGQNTIGTILYNGTLGNSYCWYVESLTNDLPTIPDTVTFSSGGRSCSFCTTTYGCPPSCEDWFAAYSTDPIAVCSQPFGNYTIAWNVSKIYVYGDCGGTLAPSGYYASEKGYIYYWDGISISEYGPCVSCEILKLSYSQLEGNAVCNIAPSYYDWDSNTGILYVEGGCGNTIADNGYYSDGENIFFWNGSSFKRIGSCGTNYVIEYCCTGEQKVLNSQGKQLSVDSWIYFLSDDPNYPIPCWRVVSLSTRESDINGLINGATYGECGSCLFQTGTSCI